jgi:predicted glycoside hydrolase/deacetylase ChbG (UPF0249 family)
VTRLANPPADDLGMCFGVNAEFLALARSAPIDWGIVMVLCSEFAEIVSEEAADPSLDLGVHLPLTSGPIGFG